LIFLLPVLRSRLSLSSPRRQDASLQLYDNMVIQRLFTRPFNVIVRDATPARTERLVVSLSVAALWTAFYWGASSSPDYLADIDQLWHGARAVMQGTDPYDAVQPGGVFDIGFPLYYPLPAVLAFFPIALAPLEWARLVFVALSTGLLAYAVTFDGWHRLPIFLSGAFIAAIASVQWSPLLTAAFLLPWLGPLLLLKPNIGLAVAASSPRRALLAWALIGGGGLVILSLAADPDWPVKWLSIVRVAPHFTPPVLLPGGFLVLLALLRWRRPEARLLVALACVPHTTLTYETLPVLLVPSRWAEAFLLAALSFAAMVLQAMFDSRIDPADPRVMDAFVEWVRTAGTLNVALVYLPATIMVLRRSNQGKAPAWLQLLGRLSARVRSGSHDPAA
jgi:hypothetical protein